MAYNARPFIRNVRTQNQQKNRNMSEAGIAFSRSIKDAEELLDRFDEEKHREKNKSNIEYKADNIIKNYADKIRDKYIVPADDNDQARLAQVIKAVEENNKKKHGTEKAEEIVMEILNCWIDDTSISQIKRDTIKSIYDSRYDVSDMDLESALDKNNIDSNLFLEKRNA